MERTTSKAAQGTTGSMLTTDAVEAASIAAPAMISFSSAVNGNRITQFTIASGSALPSNESSRARSGRLGPEWPIRQRWHDADEQAYRDLLAWHPVNEILEYLQE
jgi:hypothetical protein